MSQTNQETPKLRNGKNRRTFKAVYSSFKPPFATSNEAPKRVTPGRMLPSIPIDLTEPTREKQQPKENQQSTNTGTIHNTTNTDTIHNTEQTGNHSAEEGTDGAGNTTVPPNPTANPNTTDAIPNQAQPLSSDEVESNLIEYKKDVTKLSKCIHHLKFLEESLSEGTVPKGLRINLKVNAVNQSDLLNSNVQRVIDRCQITIMEELKAHYIRTCTELETRISQIQDTLSRAPDETTITTTYKEMESKVNSLNTKLDQRREKKRQGVPPTDVQPRRQHNRRNQTYRQGNNPPDKQSYQFRPRKPEQNPPGHRTQERFNRQQIPRYRNNYNVNSDINHERRPILEQPPLFNNSLPPRNYPNQHWGNINPQVQGNQLGGLANTLNLLLQTLQPPPVYQSSLQPPFLYQR